MKYHVLESFTIMRVHKFEVQTTRMILTNATLSERNQNLNGYYGSNLIIPDVLFIHVKHETRPKETTGIGSQNNGFSRES